jgi:hypothetical protein
MITGGKVTDTKPLIGIIICMLLVTNISAVLGNTDNIPQRIDTEMGLNLAPNPSFEEGDTMPTGWTYDPDTNGIYHWDSDYARSGNKSVGVLNLTNPDQEGLMWTTDFIPADLGMYTYVFSAWFKFIGVAPKSQHALISIQKYDINYHLVGGEGTGLEYIGPEWHQLSMEVGYSESAKYVKLKVGQECSMGYEPDPLVEVRFDDIYFGYGNVPPNTPTIIGEANGHVGISYKYTVHTTDVNQDRLVYFIDWGDGFARNHGVFEGFFESGKDVTVSHTWWKKGVYTIKVKAIDIHHAESDWATLSVTMPYSYNIPFMQFWERLFERFPNAFPILQYLLGFNQ